jgi:four helix bundle protein
MKLTRSLPPDSRNLLAMLAHERLLAWREAHQLALRVYRTTTDFPRSEQYGLTSQVRRAAVSVAANIAEGAAKRGAREFRRYLDIALGSMAEVTYLLRLAHDLRLIPDDQWNGLEDQRRRASTLLWRLYRVVSGRSGKPSPPP